MLIDLRRMLLVAGLLGAGAIAVAAGPGPNAVTGMSTGTDPVRCGAEGRTCPVPMHGKATCGAGKCAIVCDAGYAACGDRCVSLQSDPQNCGACGQVCPGEDAVPGASYCDPTTRRACVAGQCKKCRSYCGGYGGYYRACS